MGVRHFFARQLSQMNHEDTKAQRTTSLNVSTLELESGENHVGRINGIFSHRLHGFPQISHLTFLIFP